MATYAQVVESIEGMMGNRTDIRAVVLSAVADAVVSLAAMHPSPELFKTGYFYITHSAYSTPLADLEITGSTEENPIQLETVSYVGYAERDDDVPLIETAFIDVDKAAASHGVNSRTPTSYPKWWTILDEVLWILPQPPENKEYTVMVVGPRKISLFPEMNHIIPLQDALIPAVRKHALAAAKIMIGEVETGYALHNVASALATKVVASKARAEIQGHTGVTLAMDEEDS